MAELLHFEDFHPGHLFALGTHVLAAEEIIDFAREFDPQPQHLDPEAAKESLLGGLAASGWCLCAITMRMLVDGLFNRATSLGSPGVEEIRWRRPVHAGDRLHLDGEVLEARGSSRPDRGFVKFRFSLLRDKQGQESERVMMFTCAVMFRRRAASPA